MIKRIIVSVVIIFAAFLYTTPLSTFGALPLIRAIKPVAKQVLPLSDEQQAIQSVRSMKASVVDIVGDNRQTVSSSTSLTLRALETVNGSGIIVDSDGIVVSNSHVVQNTSFTYRVVFADGTEYPARVLGLDKFDDIAILKIEAHNLPAARLGNSDNLETGQSVFVIGNSLGRYQNSVTRGVVSGLGRAISRSNDEGVLQPRLRGLIQTDAAINPGNSGGPLINMAGEVVGMSTVIDTGGSALGFAIPVNMVKKVVDELKIWGKVSKPFAGLRFTTITKAIKESEHLSVDRGALVVSVVPGSPAEVSGLQPWDIVTAVNNQLLTAQKEFDVVVSSYRAGMTVTLTIIRNGKQMDVPIMLGEYK